MSFVGLFLALAISDPNTVPGPPVLGGQIFHSLVATAHQKCPGARVEHLSPAGLLGIEEQFRTQLGRQQRRRLDAFLPRDAKDGVAECANQNGASCVAIAYLRGLGRARLTLAFMRDLQAGSGSLTEISAG
jgi:hypothetical protein